MSYPQLENLVESGLRRSCTASEYSDELRTLAERASAGNDLQAAGGLFAALSSPTRLVILKLLAPRELCVCEISFALRMTQPTTSHHLQILERAGLIAARPKGKWTFYRITDRRVLQMMGGAIRMSRRSRAAPALTGAVRPTTRRSPGARTG